MSAPNILQTTLRASAAIRLLRHDYCESSETALSKAYTGAELNTLVKNLGLTAGNAAPVTTISTSVKTGDNMTPVYSNVVPVNITAYTIDMSVGFILDSKKLIREIILYSAASDGIYKGSSALVPGTILVGLIIMLGRGLGEVLSETKVAHTLVYKIIYGLASIHRKKRYWAS